MLSSQYECKTNSIYLHNEKYKIDLALYYKVDEVGAFVLEGIEKAAEEMGIKLLVTDLFEVNYVG